MIIIPRQNNGNKLNSCWLTDILETATPEKLSLNNWITYKFYMQVYYLRDKWGRHSAHSHLTVYWPMVSYFPNLSVRAECWILFVSVLAICTANILTWQSSVWIGFRLIGAPCLSPGLLTHTSQNSFLYVCRYWQFFICLQPDSPHITIWKCWKCFCQYKCWLGFWVLCQ